MCLEHVDDPHANGRKVSVNDLVIDLSLTLSHARFYGLGHRHVEEAIENTLTSLHSLLAGNDNRPIEIGTADGFLFHDRRPLLSVDHAAERIRPVLEVIGAGGISFGPETTARDLNAVVELAGRRDLLELGLEGANTILQKEGARGTKFLGAYAVGEGLSDFAARTLGTSTGGQADNARESIVAVPDRLYERVFDHLTNVMMRIIQGDMFLIGDTKEHVAGLLRSLNDDAAQLLDDTTRRTSRSDVFQFRHSIRVACLALTISRSLTDDQKLLHRIGAAALLHDVGKRFVPSSVLRHNGRLEGEMLEQMQSHAEEGAKWLMRMPDADPLATAIAFGHHRTVDQGGYPHTLHTASLSPATKIVKICDVYEALTAERPYKDPMPPRRAYRIMRDMGPHFDGPLFHRFILVNGVWPVGSRVRLESEAVARVIEQTEDLEKPILRIEGETDDVDLRDPAQGHLGSILDLEPPEQDDVGSIRNKTASQASQT